MTAPGSGSADRPRRPGRKALIGLTIAVVGFLLLEGLASLGLFVFDFVSASAPRVFRPHTQNDTLLGWVNRPGFTSPDEFGPGIGVKTTAEGFRMTAHPPDPGRDEPRIVCSGDSFTMGYGVADEKAWCSLLTARFPGVAAANMGQGAYGLDQAYLWYRRDGRAPRGGVHVVGITNVMLERFQTGNYMGRFKPFFVLDGRRLVVRNTPVPVQTEAALRWAYAAKTLEDLRLLQLIRKVLGVDGTLRVSGQVEQRWSVIEAMLDEMAAADRDQGIQLLLVYLPIGRERQPGPQDPRRARLAEFAAKRGVPFLDLTPALRALPGDSADLAFISRVAPGSAPGILGHYSDLGNAWAAEWIARQLATIPPPAATRPDGKGR